MSNTIAETTPQWTINTESPHGIAVRENQVLITASNHLILLDKNTGVRIHDWYHDKFRNLHSVEFSPFDEDLVLIVSSGAECIIEFNIKTGQISWLWES